MENQDREAKEEDLFPSIGEEENIFVSGPWEADDVPESDDVPEEMSQDSSEEFSVSPPSPIDGDMKSLPLSEEIKKQKKSETKTKKLALIGVAVCILLLVLFGVFKSKDSTSTQAESGFFSITRKLGLVKNKAEKKRASAEAGKEKSKKPGNFILATGEPGDYFLAGIEYHDAGKTGEAIKAFQAGMEKNPELKEVGYNNQGVIYAEDGEYKKAISYFKMALKINPRYADAHYNLASAYEKARNEQRALFHYQRFIELAEKNYSGLTMTVKQHLGGR